MVVKANGANGPTKIRDRACTGTGREPGRDMIRRAIYGILSQNAIGSRGWAFEFGTQRRGEWSLAGRGVSRLFRSLNGFEVLNVRLCHYG